VVFEPAPLYTYYRDADGDGYGDPNDMILAETQPSGYVTDSGDCADGDNTVYPGASELCDGIDNDCDGVVPAVETTDADGDGVVCCNDCDESDPNTYPGAPELCDGKDNDCDGVTPSDEVDSDADGVLGCEGDCDPNDNTVYPGASELCDGKDNDCNGVIDDPNAITYDTYYRDADEDTYGDPNDSQYDCAQPAGYVLDATDCDDTDAAINPGATEVCDGIDNDCDGVIDDPNELTYETYYPDADGDGYGNGDPNTSQIACAQPDGYVLDPNDCDDTDAAINPGATEVYDGIDNDCQGGVDDHCYFVTDLTAIGQEFGGNQETVYVEFGLDSLLAGTTSNPDNSSANGVVRLQLIDQFADITDPNTFVPADYLVFDVRDATGQTEIAWYVLVEIGDEADPNDSGYYPILTWDPNNLGCLEVNGDAYEYRLISGLGDSGVVLVQNMADTDSYQTGAQDGDPTQYFTILWTQTPEPPPPPRKPSRQIFPWPGVFPGGLGWGGIPFSVGYPLGISSRFTSGYAPGLSIPSFPGTFTGFTYPGWSYPSWTPTVPRFPTTFPTMGLFSTIGFGWNRNYFIGFPSFSYNYPRPGYFYPYR
jgi:hypothetical protein